MQLTRLYVGLDVDDTRYHGSALNKNTGEVIDFHCRPTLKSLIVQLDKLAKSLPGCSIAIRNSKPVRWNTKPHGFRTG